MSEQELQAQIRSMSRVELEVALSSLTTVVCEEGRAILYPQNIELLLNATQNAVAQVRKEQK